MISRQQHSDPTNSLRLLRVSQGSCGGERRYGNSGEELLGDRTWMVVQQRLCVVLWYICLSLRTVVFSICLFGINAPFFVFYIYFIFYFFIAIGEDTQNE